MAHTGTLTLLLLAAGPLLAQGNQWQKDTPRRPPVYRASGNPNPHNNQAVAGTKLTQAQAARLREQGAAGAPGKPSAAPNGKAAPKKLPPTAEHRIGKQIRAENRH